MLFLTSPKEIKCLKDSDKLIAFYQSFVVGSPVPYGNIVSIIVLEMPYIANPSVTNSFTGPCDHCYHNGPGIGHIS